MKHLFTAVMMFVFFSIGISGCGNEPSDGGKTVDPKEILSTLPSGAPPSEGKIIQVEGVRGLIPNGDSVLVQVISGQSRAESIWRQHEADVEMALASSTTSAQQEPNQKHRFLQMIKPGENKDHVYYLLEPTEPPKLRAMCVGLFSFDRPNTPCYFTYRQENKLVQFTLDAEVVSSGNFEEVEAKILDTIKKLNSSH